MAFALYGVDLDDTFGRLKNADFRYLIPMSLVLVAFYWLKAWRWQLLLQPVKRLTVLQLTPPMMVGFMANNLLPAHLGELVRVLVLGQKYDIKKSTVLSTVVLERVFDILAILLLLGVSLMFVTDMPGPMEDACKVIGVGALCGVITLVIYLTYTSAFLRFVEGFLNFFSFLPKKLRDGILSLLTTASEGLESVRSPKLLVGIAVSSLVQWFLNGMMIYLSGKATGLPISVADSMMVMGAIVFAILLPSPPGYFGVLQGAFKVALAGRFDESAVAACSIFYHMAQFIPVTLTGLVMMPFVDLKFGDLWSAAKGKTDERPQAESSVENANDTPANAG